MQSCRVKENKVVEGGKEEETGEEGKQAHGDGPLNTSYRIGTKNGDQGYVPRGVEQGQLVAI